MFFWVLTQCSLLKYTASVPKAGVALLRRRKANLGRKTRCLATTDEHEFLLFSLQGLLISCNQMSAEYLFMQDKLYDVQYDTGDKVIQCGRHNDIFKLWLQWRAKVPHGLLIKFLFLSSAPISLQRKSGHFKFSRQRALRWLSSGLLRGQVYQRFRRSFLPPSSITMMMEAANFYQSTSPHNPRDSHLQKGRLVKVYIIYIIICILAIILIILYHPFIPLLKFNFVTTLEDFVCSYYSYILLL